MKHPKLACPILYPVEAKSSDEAILILDCKTESNALIFSLEMVHMPDNRLTPRFVDDCWLIAMDDIERAWRADWAGELEGGPGTGAAALVTSGSTKQHRFFSNGLNLDDGPRSITGWFEQSFHRLLSRILTFPIPTVAAINGHAFAGGFSLAMAHDYRILKDAQGKGGQAMLCLNEVHFGASLPPGMCGLTRGKTRPEIFKRIVVEGHRFKSKEALQSGLVDALANSGDETVTQAFKLAVSLSQLPSKGVVGLIKEEAYKEIVASLKLPVSMRAAENPDYIADKRLGPARQSKL